MLGKEKKKIEQYKRRIELTIKRMKRLDSIKRNNSNSSSFSLVLQGLHPWNLHVELQYHFDVMQSYPLKANNKVASYFSVYFSLRTASIQTALHCAPLKSSVHRDNSSKLTSLFVFILRLWICMIRARAWNDINRITFWRRKQHE